MREGDRFVPKIPVYLRYKGKKIFVMALLDSGADRTFIPEDIASLLDIPYHRGKEETITGIDKELRCTSWKIDISVEGDIENYEIKGIPADVPKYSSKKVGVLLGREGFFDFFDVTFCETSKDIFLRKVGEK